MTGARILSIVLFAVLIAFSNASPTFAAGGVCTAPAGNEGDLIYNDDYDIVQYCAGSNIWIKLGGGTVDQKPYVERYVEGVMNMMRALGVIEGEVKPAREDQIFINEIGIVRPRHGGWIETLGPKNGEQVDDEMLLGRIVNPYTFETVEELRGPFARGVMLMHHPSRNLVQPGEYGFLVANLDGVEAAA